MKNGFDLTRPLPFKARRSSSYDRTGDNGDSIEVMPGEKLTMLEVTAAGEIHHIWMAVEAPDEPYYLRRNLIRMYWDGESTPSVECPLGDFFGLGHSRSYTHSNACFATSVNDEERQGEGVSMNCFVPMPFKKSARIEFFNDQSTPLRVYFYVDWAEYREMPDDIFTFHASWRRENPVTLPDNAEGDPLFAEMKEGRNLTDKYNYLLLYAKGCGNFLGVNMSIDNIGGEWYGEGDDMFFIDREDCSRECGGAWPPDLHGTGTEDYFCHAWGMQSTHNDYCGEAWCEDKFFLRAHNCNGKVCLFRFHIADPIPFEENIRVSIEHGHANDRSDDYASTAYWYQAEPHSEESYEALPSSDERLPRGPSRTGRRLVMYM